jgi:hypothetical protein
MSRSPSGSQAASPSVRTQTDRALCTITTNPGREGARYDPAFKDCKRADVRPR